MRLLYRRVLHSIDNHGLQGTVLRALGRPFQRHTAQADSRPEPPAIHPFDLRHGTDTSGYVPGEALATGAAADLYNTAYYGISPSTLVQALRELPLERGEYSFVDLGCGKGRALLVAAHEGFKRMVGVELSPELAAIARANCGAYAEAEIQVADAATVRYPAGPLVVFFYHPFLAPLLRKVLANLRAQGEGREIFLLSANPGYPQVFARYPEFEEEWTKDLTLSGEDAAADRHGIVFERYKLWRMRKPAIA